MCRLIIKIALASLTRRKSRTLLAIIMISTSLWGLLVMEGLYDGMTEQMISNSIRAGSGHITMLPRGYRHDPDITKRIRTDRDIEMVLDRDPRVNSFVSRIEQDGLIATARYARNARIYGVDLQAEQQHGSMEQYLQEGNYDFGPKGRGAIIGFKLADRLKIGLGNKVVISAQNTEKDVSSMPLKIVGIFKTNNMAVDESGLFMDRTTAAKLMNVQESVTRINILLHSEGDISGLQQHLQKKYADLDTLRWDEIYPALMQSRVMMQGFNLVTNLLVFCIAGLGIFGVILVSVIERIREFGIMQAVGTEFSLISGIVLTESLSMGLIGYVLGSLLGGASLIYFARHGLDLTTFSAGLDEFGLATITYAIIRPGYFITALLAVVMATLISVIFPLRILKRAKPIEAINSIG